MEPLFEGVVESFDFATGLGVVGAAVTCGDTKSCQCLSETVPEGGGVIGEEALRPSPLLGGVTERIQ